MRNRKLPIVISSFLLLLLVGCDTLYPLSINGKETVKLNSACGEVELKTWIFVGSRIIININASNAGFKANLKELKLNVPDSTMIWEVYWIKAGERFKEDEVQFQPNNADISLNILLAGGGAREAQILPSNFIMCQGNPVIQDTLKIR